MQDPNLDKFRKEEFEKPDEEISSPGEVGSSSNEDIQQDPSNSEEDQSAIQANLVGMI